MNKVYKEDAGDGAATGNIFCSGEQITERDATTTLPRETGTTSLYTANADHPPPPSAASVSGVGVGVATRRRYIADATLPTIFNRRSPAAKKVAKRQLMQRLLTLGRRGERGKVTRKTEGWRGARGKGGEANGGSVCTLNVLREE